MNARKINKSAVVTGVATFLVTGLIFAAGEPEAKIVRVEGPERVVTETVEVEVPDDRYEALEDGYEDLQGRYNDALDKTMQLKSRLEKTEKQSPPPPAEVAVTPGMENAVATARDYLDYTSFSLQGLIEQLKYEGFSTAEATYGATKAYK